MLTAALAELLFAAGWDQIGQKESLEHRLAILCRMQMIPRLVASDQPQNGEQVFLFCILRLILFECLIQHFWGR